MASFADYERMVNRTLPALASRDTSLAESMRAQLEEWSNETPSQWWAIAQEASWESNDLEAFIEWVRKVWATNPPPRTIQGFWVCVPELESECAETYLTGSESFDPFDDGWASGHQWCSLDGANTDCFKLARLAAFATALESTSPKSIKTINGRPPKALMDEVYGVGYAAAMAYVTLLVVHATRELAATIAPAKTKYFACSTRNDGSVISVCQVDTHGARPFINVTRNAWKQQGNKLHADPWSGNAETVALYLEEGGDPNIKLDTSPILYVKATHGLVEIVKLLLEAGADINARNEHGATALHASTGHFETLRELINAGADVDAADLQGWTPLHRLVSSATAWSKSAQVLLQAGASVHRQTHRGTTALDEMCRISSSDESYVARFDRLLKQLLEHGANINRVGQDGMTAIGMAVVHESFWTGQVLVKYGADPNTRLPAPFVAAWSRDKLRRLPDNATPLMATIYKFTGFHDALLAAGANPLLRCDAGLTAIDHARLMRSSKWSDPAAVDRVIAAMEASVARTRTHHA